MNQDDKATPELLGWALMTPYVLSEKMHMQACYLDMLGGLVG
jgi:hypothetical protein